MDFLAREAIHIRVRERAARADGVPERIVAITRNHANVSAATPPIDTVKILFFITHSSSGFVHKALLPESNLFCT
jgi:hypothetical protein